MMEGILILGLIVLSNYRVITIVGGWLLISNVAPACHIHLLAVDALIGGVIVISVIVVTIECILSLEKTAKLRVLVHNLLLLLLLLLILILILLSKII